MQFVVCLLSVIFALSGCTWFASKKPETTATRIDINQAATSLAADPDAAADPMVLPEAMQNTAWPVEGGIPTHAPQHLALKGQNLQKRWSRDIGKGSGNNGYVLSQPVLMGETLAVMDAAATVSLLNTTTGKIVWETSLKPDYEDRAVVSGGLAHGGQVLFAATGYGELIALALNDGRKLWSVTLPAPARAAPMLAGDQLYVITSSNELLAYNASNGQALWSHAGLTEQAALLGGATPAVNREMVIAAYSSGEIIALAVENGRPLWEENISGNLSGSLGTGAALSDVAGSPVLDRELVFAASNSGQLAAIEARTGARRWTQSLGSYTTPWAAGNSLFVLTNENQVIALTRGGLVRWITPLARFKDAKDREDPIVWTAPILAGNRLWLASNSRVLLALDPASGKVVSETRTPAPVLIPPVVAGGTLYLLDEDGYLSAWN